MTSMWLNTTNPLWKYVVRPCWCCGFCPYGRLVEEFPSEKDGDMSCEVFGHNCPAYYHIEYFREDKRATKEEMDRFIEEMKEKKFPKKR